MHATNTYTDNIMYIYIYICVCIYIYIYMYTLLYTYILMAQHEPNRNWRILPFLGGRAQRWCHLAWWPRCGRVGPVRTCFLAMEDEHFRPIIIFIIGPFYHQSNVTKRYLFILYFLLYIYIWYGFISHEDFAMRTTLKVLHGRCAEKIHA